MATVLFLTPDPDLLSQTWLFTFQICLFSLVTSRPLSPWSGQTTASLETKTLSSSNLFGAHLRSLYLVPSSNCNLIYTYLGQVVAEELYSRYNPSQASFLPGGDTQTCKMNELSKLFVMLWFGLVLWTTPIHAIGTHRFKVGGQAPTPFKAPSPNSQAPHVLSLSRQSGTSRSAGYVQSLRKGNEVQGVYGFAPLTSVEMGQVFLTGIEFGTESFQAVVDTGTLSRDLTYSFLLALLHFYSQIFTIPSGQSVLSRFIYRSYSLILFCISH